MNVNKLWYNAGMKKLLVAGTVVALVAVGGAGVVSYNYVSKHVAMHNTSLVSPIQDTQPATQPAPAPQPVQTTQTAPTTTADPAPIPTATPLFSDSSTNYAPGAVATTASISIDGPWTMNYSYSCDGSNGVIISFHNNAAGGSFGAGNQGSSYTGSLPIAGPSYGTFRVIPPDGETCTWSISGTN